MDTITTIDMLTPDSVSIKTQHQTVLYEKKYNIGEPHRCAYVNSPIGRTELASEVPEPYLSAVLAVWGDTATLTDHQEDSGI